MTRLKLPIGIQSFEKLISGGYTYVDKTRYIAELVKTGTVYFLSRPRRFGKSLLVDTMACAFSGRRGLFKGLYLDMPESGWDWNEKNSVIKISFAQMLHADRLELRKYICRMLDEVSHNYSINAIKEKNPAYYLSDLVKKLHAQDSKRVVVLIDEYDKPILDTIDNPVTAAEMRDELKNFYSALKDVDEYLRFVFFTGVSKFSKTGIFSGLNNLEDISINKENSSICGYTENELQEIFADYLSEHNHAKVRKWYNGYSWTGESVYNPFDVLLLFKQREFKAYWFETGTPTFLVKLWKQEPRNPAEYDGLVAGEETIGSFEIQNLSLTMLLFQSGYLTIKETLSAGSIIKYRLGFPNLEVQSAFSQLLLINTTDANDINGRQIALDSIIKTGDSQKLHLFINSFLASIPHDWHRRNNIAEYEGYWATIFYTLFAGMGYAVIPEDVTSRGNIDMTVKTPHGIWIFEFKVKGASGNRYGFDPLIQTQDKEYEAKYRGSIGKDGKTLPVFQAGILFNPETRCVEKWEVLCK